MEKISPKKNKGFTLIELMVATSIFVVIMLASMSALFIMLNAAKNSKALRFAMDNVNFAMESMTRSIRMGTNYYCGSLSDSSINTKDLTKTGDCTSTDGSGGGTLLAFKPQDALATNKVVYKLSRADDGTNYIARCGEGNACVSIISPLVNIEKLKFFVDGSSPDDTKQASVYIIIKGTVILKGVPTSFAIQTMASQRNF
jgi:prepilin-type N-terminal cleavage/methylation domain-containing protein